ncbi:sulfatase family protein [Paraglaciecola chathamensis]|nr:sulfatase [Paraglaciecola chathamensis]
MGLFINNRLIYLVISMVPAIFIIGCMDQYLSASVTDDERNIDIRPNIIFYLADDQDYTDYGFSGNEKVNTSAIDRLAKEGMVFSNTFTGQAICAPSRSQLFTGKYPIRNGTFANHTPTKPEIISVTKKMRQLGYEVVLAGKSHVKPANVYDWDQEWTSIPKAGVPRDYIPLEEIEEYFLTAEKPFVMFIASKYPHGKYFTVENPKSENLEFYPHDEHLKNNPDYISKRAGYYRSIQEDNTQLESVLNMVDRNLGDNTLFIYSSDHGVSGKFTVKDIGLKVPLVARWPGLIRANSHSEQLIHFTDVLPTFIEIAGGKPDKNLDGESFLPLLKGVNKPIHQYVYGVSTNQNIINTHVFPSRMIRDNRYKYIRNFNALDVLSENLTNRKSVNIFLRLGAEKHPDTAFEELYDLKSDPFEKINLIDAPHLQETVQRLKGELFSWMTKQGDFLDERMGNVPLLLSPTFKLDQNNPLRKNKLKPENLNILKEEDYLKIEHWLQKD